jgi:pimeloyl-ACP methyl ester carboxylesterase
MHHEPLSQLSSSSGEENEDENISNDGKSRLMPSYPFPADFHLEFQQQRIEACQHFCRRHPEGTRTIVLFFPGVHGGVGPCRAPGKNFDEDALFPRLARRLADVADVDCYRCSWPFMRPQMSYAIGGACRILHHALLQALKGHSSNTSGERRELRVCFVGHSLGGAVALHAAEVVAKHFGVDGTGGQRMEGLESAIVRLWGVCTLNSAIDTRQQSRGVIFDSLRACQALLVCGDADEVISNSATTSMWKALPVETKRHVVLPGGTHHLFEYKDHLLSELEEFIRSSIDSPDPLGEAEHGTCSDNSVGDAEQQ